MFHNINPVKTWPIDMSYFNSWSMKWPKTALCIVSCFSWISLKSQLDKYVGKWLICVESICPLMTLTHGNLHPFTPPPPPSTTTHTSFSVWLLVSSTNFILPTSIRIYLYPKFDYIIAYTSMAAMKFTLIELVIPTAFRGVGLGVGVGGRGWGLGVGVGVGTNSKCWYN